MIENINNTEYAKETLEKEINGLELTRESLSDSFNEAIELLYEKRKGHVIVSGMGKPGHIARKIAATLSSTGTPAFFLHPGEASHGDLGVISPEDVLLVLSWSGNTQELVPMLTYATRFGIKIVGITSNKESILAKSSTVVILLPKVEEACPHNLAPTTSTTMMIAVGDAIALCLLKKKEFHREDFKQLHPGGTLGKRLMLVQDLMHTDVPAVPENMLMVDVLIEMTQKSFGCACVLNDQKQIVGIITDGDLRRSISVDFLGLKASQVMSTDPKTISKNAFAQEATRIMNQYKITSLFVCDEDKIPQGIIHIHDCLRAGLV